MFSNETFALLNNLLNNITLKVGDPDFEGQVRVVTQAKRELEEVGVTE